MPTVGVGKFSLSFDEYEQAREQLNDTLRTKRCYHCRSNIVKETGWKAFFKAETYYNCPGCHKKFRTGRAIAADGWGDPYTFLREYIEWKNDDGTVGGTWF